MRRKNRLSRRNDRQLHFVQGNCARLATAGFVAFHNDTLRVAAMFSAAGVSGLAPIRHLELDHVYLQLVMRGKSAKLLL
jgi:hypothetical protein